MLYTINRLKRRYTMLIVIIFVVSISAAAIESVKKTIPFESVKKRITAEIYQPDFLWGDSGYTALLAASMEKYIFPLAHTKTIMQLDFFVLIPLQKK